MNLNISKGQLNFWLPKALEGEQGKVDSEFLHTLWQRYPKSSAKIRSLIKDLSAVTLSPKDSAIDKLAELVVDPSFFSRWLTQDKKPYPSLLAIIWAYFEGNDPSLGFENLKKIGFFVPYKSIKNIYLPELSKVPDLIRLIENSKLENRYKSLFIWKMLTDSIIGQQTHPGQFAIQEFYKEFVLALEENGFSHLLVGAYEAKWTRSESVRLEQSFFDVLTEVGGASLAYQEEPIAQTTQTTQRCEIGERFLASLKELEQKVDKYSASSTILISKIKSLASEDDPSLTLRQIRDSSIALEDLCSEVKSDAVDLLDKIDTSLNLEIKKLGASVEYKQRERFSFVSSAQWFENVSCKIEFNSEVFLMLRGMDNVEVLSRVSMENISSNTVYKYEDLKGSAEYLVETYEQIVSGFAAEKEFIEAIRYNCSNLCWNVYQDSTLSNEAWLFLAEYYLLTGELGVKLGILAQRTFEAVSLKLGNLISRKLHLSDASTITECVCTLSWLTLGQQEQLARMHPSLKTLVALTQMDAYLKSLSQGMDSYIYWSTSPLGDISNNHSSLAVRNFFKSIYDIVSTPSIEPLNSQTLALCVSGVQIGNARAQDEKTSLDSFIEELREILDFRKKGGRTTYAHIWQAAYDEIFAPLLEDLTSNGVKGFLSRYESLIADFEVEYYIDGWKAEIPDHLKKNSEYDKFIRNQVSLKLSEIQDWVNIYRSVTQKAQLRKADPLVVLKSNIGVVFKSSEHDCAIVRGWLESKTTEQKFRSNSYVCQNRNWSTDLACVADFKEVDALHPRAFSKVADGAVTYEEIYTDDLVAGFGFGTTEYLLDIYASNNLFEGYAAVANDTSEEVSPSLDREVERLIEELTLELTQRIAALEGMSENAALAKALSAAQLYLDNQQWRLAEKALSNAEIIALEINESSKTLEERTFLLHKIAKLGGHSPALADADNVGLNKLLNQLQDRYKEQRMHVKVLERLLSLSGSEFDAQLQDCINHLDCVERYPSAVSSGLVAYYLEQAIDPICSELSRSRTLLATYVSQLRKLGKILLLNIRNDDKIFEEHSNLISILVDTAEQWQRISSEGKAGVDKILQVFVERGFVETEAMETDHSEIAELAPTQKKSIKVEDENFEVLLVKAKQVADAIDTSGPTLKLDIASLINHKSWDAVARCSLAKLSESKFTSSEDLANWAVSSALSAVDILSTTELSYTLRMINGKVKSSVVRYLHQEKSMRAHVGDLVARLIRDMACINDLSFEKNNGNSSLEALQSLQANMSSSVMHQDNFRLCFEVDVFETIGLKAFWERFAGDQKQAEARAILMYLAWRFHSPRALAYCLTMPPIELEKRKAEALASVAEDALVSGNGDLLQGFFDLKKSIQAKPFQIFADLVLSNSISHSENAAKLTLLGGLERHGDGTLRSVLRIEPRRVDSPDSITLKLPNNCPVRFSNGTSTEKFSGPFFVDSSLPVSFKLMDEFASKFIVELECSVVSLTGVYSNFSQTVEFSIFGDDEFEPLSADEIDDAFDNFPDVHMRGDNYVARVIDEQKIEKALFRSKTVRSVWISSPRRSGKTTMLYRILDAFSHKVNRDNLVVYLTLDEAFADSTSFNRWVWRRLRTFNPNKELRELYEDFEAIGRDLPFDSDAGTFIGELSDRLLSFREPGTRIIFLIDEIDRFAAMYFEGGVKKSTAIDILWQIRHTVTDRRDIGLVFAGSSAAKQIFITDAESPFYNSIDHLELTPFSCKNKALEDAARQIVEPRKVRAKYEFPRDTLEHLIWVCAGIPYYMKLVAGATFARAKQTHILRADVNEGLRALLARDTGISKLDDMGGDPGSDDLRTTISIEKSEEAILAKAVLYSFADLHSPISGHKTYRGKISSAESRLVSHYNISKAKIDRGLDICISLGLIRLIETESVPEIDFVIPILGESLRKSSGRLWANIDHELAKLAQGAS